MQTMKNHKGIFIRLHNEHDKNIIEKLSQVTNKQGYIKELIKTDNLFYHNFIRKGENDG